MLTTRGLLGIIREYMPEEPQQRVIQHLNRAYLRLCQNDIKDFVYIICDNDDDLEFPYPVLNRTTTDGDSLVIPQKNCVDIIADNFSDENGNPLGLVGDGGPTFRYHGQEVTCRKINSFFVRKNKDYYYPTNQTPYESFSPFYNVGYAGRGLLNTAGNFEFARFPGDPRVPTQLRPAQMYFWQRPYGDEINGDTGNIYVEFWFTPKPITTADSQMLLDVDKWQDELINGAIGYWEDNVNGFSERLEKFLKFDRKQFMNEGNSNLHNRGNNQFIVRDIG